MILLMGDTHSSMLEGTHSGGEGVAEGTQGFGLALVQEGIATRDKPKVVICSPDLVIEGLKCWCELKGNFGSI